MHPETVIYKDAQVKAHYKKYGFAVVENFLTEEETGTILQETKKFDSALSGVAGFSTSTDNDNRDFRIAMRDVINRVVSPGKTASFFEGYTAFYSNLLIKKPHAQSEMVLHTDWSITDETLYPPLQIWIPLVDVNRENGTLAVVPGSHHFTNVYRGLGVDEPYMQYGKELADYLYYFEVKKGTAVFYHPGILHYSPHNLSKDTRMAVLVSYYPSAMQPVLYHQKRFHLLNNISVYELTPGFFSTWDKRTKPDLKKLRSVRQPARINGKSVFLNNLEKYKI